MIERAEQSRAEQSRAEQSRAEICIVINNDINRTWKVNPININ